MPPNLPTLECLRPSNFFPFALHLKIYYTNLEKLASQDGFRRRFLKLAMYQPENFMVQIRTGNVLKRSLLL